MAQQNARELVIKRSNSDSPETFTFVCGLRTRSLTVGNAAVDTTVPDCDDPSLPIVETSKPGRQTLRFSGSGLFDNDAVGVAVWEDSRSQAETRYQIIIPGVGTYEGPFMIGDFEFSGEMDEQLAFSATWIPTDRGELVYTAESGSP